MAFWCAGRASASGARYAAAAGAGFHDVAAVNTPADPAVIKTIHERRPVIGLFVRPLARGVNCFPISVRPGKTGFFRSTPRAYRKIEYPFRSDGESRLTSGKGKQRGMIFRHPDIIRSSGAE